ncbi:hypothetical protein FN976_12385 [Caenimonas sedimenti]|uniref:Uncharacterized protein n=1 Tax=Caenimonas sedimenti TaxID=2596921 RepID=A0A562ZR76_9BURK|nr:hypothetical protein [Caenimonas sedimenti]TWO71110.1 hypothetical protein FN976_12385 [Caenimonas sedimenti]
MFWYWIVTGETQTVLYDQFLIEVYDQAGTRLGSLGDGYSNLNAATNWKQGAVNLSAYKGQTVELRFSAITDGSGPTTFYIDDVSLSSVTAGNYGLAAPANGMWWNPQESGRGFFIDRQGNQISLGAYMYEESGSATWYTGLATLQADGTYQGALIRYAGGQTLTGSYQAPGTTQTVAQVTLLFTTGTTGTIVVEMTGGGGRNIQIQLFRAGSGPAASNAQFNNGTWWNESESGRGFVLEVQGNTVMLGSFMYEASGQPVWYLATGSLASASSFTLPLVQNAGGQSLNGNYKAPAALFAPIGSVTFQATSATTATLTLPGGRQIPLKRLVFNTGT